MSQDDYRLPAYPKRTIREKQGSHGDMSNWKGDYTFRERAIYASERAREGRFIKVADEIWGQRSCKKDGCSAAMEIGKGWSPTCRKIKQCPWAQHWGIDKVQGRTTIKKRIVFTYTHENL